MTAVVTGAAGFIGSHLCRLLLDEGHEVIGVDSFTDYYPREYKEEHLAGLRGRPGFWMVDDDLLTMRLEPLIDGAEYVFHLAGQPGVRGSWGADFATYVRQNVLVTQHVLETCRNFPPAKLVYASSSSIYGDAESFPTPETVHPRPVSPYGVTKLAGEFLCDVYRTNFGLPTLSLRLFTVYGPGQRPDMAFARLVRCGRLGHPFQLLGDGRQSRDFTFVGDVVRAMVDAARSPWCGTANIGGGSRVTMNEVVDILSGICGPLQVVRREAAIGDVRHTAADCTTARTAFGYRPSTSLRDGLALMVDAAADLVADMDAARV
jgi:nucleoside-diphosphate-sugar epimerase